METNQLLINYYKKEELKKAKARFEEGLTKDEIFNLANKEYVSIEEIKQALGIDDDYEFEEEVNQELESNREEHIIDEQDIIIEDEEQKDVIQNKETVEVVMIDDDKLENYPNQPFKLYNEDKKKEMIESIRINGIMQPLIVRKLKNGNYQILAGHNRRICGREIGLKQFPCIIKDNLTDDEAKIYLIDTNLCTRENISIMEKAKAYRIKYDTYKRRNIKTSIEEEIKRDNVGITRAALIKEEKTSNGTIQRYLRLTYLIPKLQDAVETDKVKITTGEKLSFLPAEEQEYIAELLEENIKISDNMAKKIRKKSEQYRKENSYNCLSKNDIREIITQREEITKKIIKVTFYEDEIEQYFNNKRTENEIKQYILENLPHTTTGMK